MRVHQNRQDGPRPAGYLSGQLLLRFQKGDKPFILPFCGPPSGKKDNQAPAARQNLGRPHRKRFLGPWGSAHFTARDQVGRPGQINDDRRRLPVINGVPGFHGLGRNHGNPHPRNGAFPQKKVPRVGLKEARTNETYGERKTSPDVSQAFSANF